LRNEAFSGSRFLTTARRFAPRCFYTAIARRALRFVSRRKRDQIRDYEVKRDEYIKIHVKEYWLIDRFARILADHHLTVSVRKSRGRDIRAACGQLLVEGQHKSVGQQLADALTR
jgi:hypothetical protein